MLGIALFLLLCLLLIRIHMTVIVAILFLLFGLYLFFILRIVKEQVVLRRDLFFLLDRRLLGQRYFFGNIRIDRGHRLLFQGFYLLL